MRIKVVFQDEETGLIFNNRSEVKKFKKIGYRNYLIRKDTLDELRGLEKQQRHYKKLLYGPHHKILDVRYYQSEVRRNSKRLCHLYYLLTEVNKFKKYY